MPDTRSDLTLMALLALEAEDAAGEPGAATSADGVPAPGLPTLDQRVDMFVHAMHGPAAAVTAEMRAAARQRLLAAMAADLADETLGPAAPTSRADAAAAPRASAAHGAAEPTGLARLWDGLAGTLQQLLSPAAEAFTMRGLRMAAVPLLALFVVGSVWTGTYWINSGNQQANENPNSPAGNGPSANEPTTRGLAPQDTAAEENLKRAIAADEAKLGSAHPTVAGKLVDLAGLYRADGRYADAEALCTRALAIQQRAVGAKDPATVRTLKELALVYRAQGRNVEADEMLSRANAP